MLLIVNNYHPMQIHAFRFNFMQVSPSQYPINYLQYICTANWSKKNNCFIEIIPWSIHCHTLSLACWHMVADTQCHKEWSDYYNDLISVNNWQFFSIFSILKKEKLHKHITRLTHDMFSWLVTINFS